MIPKWEFSDPQAVQRTGEKLDPREKQLAEYLAKETPKHRVTIRSRELKDGGRIALTEGLWPVLDGFAERFIVTWCNKADVPEEVEKSKFVLSKVIYPENDTVYGGLRVAVFVFPLSHCAEAEACYEALLRDATLCALES